MAKKVKRKVSQVSSNGQAAHIAEVTAEGLAPEAPIASTPVSAARAYSRRTATATDFNPDYSYVVKDLKRIGVLASTFFALLIVLYFVLPYILP